MAPLRLPAEWETSGAVLIAWPHADTDWAYMLPEVTACFSDIASAIVNAGEILVVAAPDTSLPLQHLKHLPQDRIIYAEVPTNDTWARDFGPISLADENGGITIADFCFNGWGLKFAADRDNLITSRLHAKGVLRCPYRNRLGFVLEGGSIESDGRGTLLTTSRCLLSANRNGDLSRDEIERYLTEQFSLRQVLWLDHGALEGDDTDSHIDTLARIAPDNTIIYVGCDDPSDPHFYELQAMKADLNRMRTPDGLPYTLIELPLPDPVNDPDDGHRLPATYANYLVLTDTILMPTYGQPRKDSLASQMLRIAYPEHEIVTVDCRALVRQHGSLHCVTMQLPRQILPI